MNGSARLRFQKGDFFAVALVILLAVAVMACFLPKDSVQSCSARIYHNGELVKTVDLSVPQSFSVTGDYTNVITVADGSICVSASDCPGEDCVHSAAIARPGRSIVCLPNGVEVRVVGEASDVDFVVG